MANIFIPRPGMWFEVSNGHNESSMSSVIRQVVREERQIIVFADDNDTTYIEFSSDGKKCIEIVAVNGFNDAPQSITFGWGPQVLHTYEVGK